MAATHRQILSCTLFMATSIWACQNSAFSQLQQKAEALSAGLAARGIGKGDTVALHSFNCIEYPVVFFALNRIGAVCSPSPTLFNRKELAQQMEIAKATAVIGHKVLEKVVVEAAQRHGIKSQRVFVFGEGYGTTETLEDLIALNLPLATIYNKHINTISNWIQTPQHLLCCNCTAPFLLQRSDHELVKFFRRSSYSVSCSGINAISTIFRA